MKTSGVHFARSISVSDRNPLRWGAYYGLVWGLFSWAAIAVHQQVSPLAGLVETVLGSLFWALVAFLMQKTAPLWLFPLIRSRFRDGLTDDLSAAAVQYAFAIIFVVFQSNYLLHPYLIAGVYLVSPVGIAVSAGILTLLALPSLLLFRGRFPRWQCWPTYALRPHCSWGLFSSSGVSYWLRSPPAAAAFQSPWPLAFSDRWSSRSV